MSKKILITLIFSSLLFARIGLVTDGDEKTFLSMCETGDMESCNDLASINEAKGNSKEAIKFYTKACDNNHSKACTNLGLLYDNEGGSNMENVIKLYEKGCEHNDTLGCGYLGLKYQSGIGVEKNLTKAIELYKKSCENGDLCICTLYDELKNEL
jgi:TPR repeat protein